MNVAFKNIMIIIIQRTLKPLFEYIWHVGIAKKSNRFTFYNF